MTTYECLAYYFFFVSFFFSFHKYLDEGPEIAFYIERERFKLHALKSLNGDLSGPSFSHTTLLKK